MNFSTSSKPAEEFFRLCSDYRGSAKDNEEVYAGFTQRAAADLRLNNHRKHVENEELGFGDPAFHFMWHLLLAAAHERFGPIQAAEIGVFKGQVISLWALLAKDLEYELKIYAISPLEGQPIPPPSILRTIRSRLDRRFKERLSSGDFYPAVDYEAIIRGHFCFHGLDFDAINLLRGYSTDAAVRKNAEALCLQVLYIDGDHTYEGARSDIEYYGPLVEIGGWLIMDDAAFDLPGTGYWKGYETVTRACQMLPDLGFTNILNVGHNRIFERTR